MKQILLLTLLSSCARPTLEKPPTTAPASVVTEAPGTVHSPKNTRTAILGEESDRIVVTTAGEKHEIKLEHKALNLYFVDENRLGYLFQDAARNKKIYLQRDAQTGKILLARAVNSPTWDAEHKHLAYVEGETKQALAVDGRVVWPRTGTARISGKPVWSPDGRGIALLERRGDSARLVVLVEFGNPQGDLTWNVPKDKDVAVLTVAWAGENRVLVGESRGDWFNASFAAAWSEER